MWGAVYAVAVPLILPRAYLTIFTLSVKKSKMFVNQISIHYTNPLVGCPSFHVKNTFNGIFFGKQHNLREKAYCKH